MMLKHVIIIDESGAKGYAKNTEQYIGDFGIMAGFLLDENDLSRMRYIINESFNDFVSEGKLHMAELNKDDKERAILRVKDFLKIYKIKWSYSALYVKGYHRFNGSPDKSSKNKELLHSTLFEHLMTKFLINGIKLAISRKINSFSLKCISDHIETATINKFKKDIAYPLRFLRGEVTVMKEDESGNKEPAFDTLEDINISIETENSALTFVSDIISYTTWKHLKDAIKKDNNIKLQSTEVMIGHPFQESLTLTNSNENSFIDDIFNRRGN
ncbi:hypothetical protein [Phytobacter sp. RSE-02]|uniref:hypothetical protein n=1 Tax=Phytobacter sp. RSE-02 TaxID=3229229 RepID=UPI00339D4900